MASAAPMQVALVPWMRSEDVDPFCNGQEAEPLVMYVDLRTCVVDGFDFDAQTLRWWSQRSEAAKQAVTRGLAEPVQDVLVGIVNYIRSLRERHHLDSICLWSQGELDTSMLRYMAAKYDIDLDDTIAHTQMRDARTVILEALLIRARQLYREAIAKAKFMANDVPYPLPPVLEADVLRGDSKAYQLFDPLPDRYANGSEAHDALYDAMRTSWNTWQALRWLSL
jgi:hypothetical protein